MLNYFTRFTGFSRDARLYLLSSALGSTGFAVWMILLNFYLQSLGFNHGFIGSINALSALTLGIAGIPVGIISDRISRKLAMTMGTIFAAGGALAVALGSSPAIIVAATVVRGLGAAFVHMNNSPFMAENSTEEQRTALFSAHAAIMTGTGFIGSIIGGYFPELFGRFFQVSPGSVLPLRLTLGFVVFTDLLAIFPILFLKPRVIKEEKQSYRIRNHTLFAKMILPTALVGFGAGMTIPFLNIFIAWKFNVDISSVGWLFAVSALVTAAGMLAQPVLADKFGKVRSVVLVQLFSLPFLILLGFSPIYSLVVASLLIRGMLMNMAQPVFAAYCMERLHPAERATFVGTQEMSWSLCWAGASAFSGWCREIYGPSVGFDAVFVITATCYLISTLLLFTLFGRKSTAEVPTPIEEKA